AYLDDAPLEERRTQAVVSRRWLGPEAAADIGRLDPAAIARVRGEAWPQAANADELHDALAWLGFLTPADAAGEPRGDEWFADLGTDPRAARLFVASADPQDVPRGPAARGEVQEPPDSRLRGNGGREAPLWIAVERLPQFRALWPAARLEPAI